MEEWKLATGILPEEADDPEAPRKNTYDNMAPLNKD